MRRWRWGALLMVLWAARAQALCDGPEACLQAIEESQRATQVLSARFEQTKHLSLLSEPLVTTGRFAFKQPDQVLWQLDEPRITVRIDSQRIYIPDVAAAEQADLAPFSAMLRELSGVFTGSWDRVRESFTVTVEPGPELLRLGLVPRREEWRRMLRGLEISFRQPDLTLAGMRMDERLGDRVEIVFTDVHRNDATAAAAFEPQEETTDAH